MPAAVVLRDILKVCDTAKEAKRIIGNREILVDGQPLRSHKMPVGFMDVLSIPKTEKNYRMLLTDKGKLTLVEISESEAKWKLCRLQDKTTVSNGRTQLNMHDGRNIVLDKNEHRTGDVLKIDLNGQKILSAYPLAPGALAMITDGPHAGKTAVVAECITRRGSAANVVKFEDGTETVKDSVFVIGKQKSAIKLPEAGII
jgi:small subunit ribosomal protein S4e